MVGQTHRDLLYKGVLNQRETDVIIKVFRAALATIDGNTKAVSENDRWINIKIAAKFYGTTPKSMKSAIITLLQKLDYDMVLDAKESKVIWALCSDHESTNKFDYELLTKQGLCKLAKNLKPKIQPLFIKIAGGGADTLIVLDNTQPAPAVSKKRKRDVEEDDEEGKDEEKARNEVGDSTGRAAVGGNSAPAELKIWVHEGRSRVAITQEYLDAAHKWDMCIISYMEWRIHNGMSQEWAVVEKGAN